MASAGSKSGWLNVAAVLAVAGSLFAADPETVFTTPPELAKPGVWWHWMGCNVSRDGITRDLEAFKAAGISSATLFALADVCTPWAGHIANSPGDGLIAFTDPWWALVGHAAAEARRLNLDLGMHNSPGYTHSGGPWIPPELSMQELCWSQTTVEGGKPWSGPLPQPQVDPRANMAFPVVNKDTNALEKPLIAARQTYYRDIAVLALPAAGLIAKEGVTDLTSRLEADGRLAWDAPAGTWILYRLGHTTMGSMTQPNQWEVRGLESDKMSVAATEFHIDHVVGELQRHLGDLVGSGLRHLLFDSYEAGTPSWTPLMPAEFATRRGYSLIPFLATFAGRVVGSEAETSRFQADFARTIADLYRDVHFATVSRRLRAAGLEFACEPYGGPFHTGEVAPYVHRVMTEFWTGGGAFSGGVQAGISNAGDGKRHSILAAEAFTGAPEDSAWTEYPAWLKPVGDGAFCAGINRLILHHAVQQPWDERYRPGNTMGRWGTHFGRLQTWWQPGMAWIAYLQRCQALLQWGEPASGGFHAEATQGGIALRSVHRRDPAAEVFFLANLARAGGVARCIFAVTDRQPELWDPVTGQRRPLTDVDRADGETAMTLDFAPTQSWFVVFRKPATAAATALRNYPIRTPRRELAGAWAITFDPRWGGPAAPVTFPALVDWTTRPEPGIRYYSGTATYRQTFALEEANLTAPTTPIFLDLGTVNHIARVTLNGRDLGVVWCAPWGVTVPPDLLRAADNALEIEVTNVWANRLIGDEQEPADCDWQPGHMGGSYLKRFPDWFTLNQPRPAAGRYAFTTWNYFTKDSALTPSGLLGPVRLLSEDWSHPGVTWPETSFRSYLADSLEADILHTGLASLATFSDEGVLHPGGGTSAESLVNGTTQNGAGGDETLDDGKTFRGYGAGSRLTVRFNGPHDLTAIRTFAGHHDARASQDYTVLVAYAAAPETFVALTSAALPSAGGASELRVTAAAPAAVALRLEFRDGPLGFNVYREIQILGTPTANP